MWAYYNEHDAYAAEWLRRLILFGHIAPGEVDERSIEDVAPDDVRGFTQCHFFAGIGVWSYALRLAGWSDERPIWTASCPCQPLSAAGKGLGFADERHLWPAFHHLLRIVRPPVVVGEQVASNDGLNWLDLVQADLEASGYASGASDLCAAGFGGAHIRQRLYFVGVADAALGGSGTGLCDSGSGALGRHVAANDSTICRLGDGQHEGLEGHAGHGDGATGRAFAAGSASEAGQLGDTNAPLLGRHPADWLYCRDGKWRPVEPGTFPLAHADPARVGRLRAYGNALDAETATGFVSAVMDCLPC